MLADVLLGELTAVERLRRIQHPIHLVNRLPTGNEARRRERACGWRTRRRVRLEAFRGGASPILDRADGADG